MLEVTESEQRVRKFIHHSRRAALAYPNSRLRAFHSRRATDAWAALNEEEQRQARALWRDPR